MLQFNARSESVNEKASFRRLMPKNRCLLAVEGYYYLILMLCFIWKITVRRTLKQVTIYIRFFYNTYLDAFPRFYEWKKDGSKKQPYYIHFEDGRPLVLAALYDSWKNSEGQKAGLTQKFL